jgi:hypothetical protein
MGARWRFVAVFLLSAAWTARASAQTPAPSDHDIAVAEFNAGRALVESGDCKGAIPHFVASLKQEQSVGTRFNLAECSAREGRAAQAFNHYRAAERLATGKGDSQRMALARAAAADLERRVTTVRVVLPSDAVVTLTIDGVDVDVTDHWLLGSGYALESGTAHTLSATAPGKPRWDRHDVRGDPGVELPAIVVDFAAPAARRSAVETTTAPTSSLRSVSLGLGAVGVAALATGGVFALLASSAKTDAKSACASSAGFSYPDTCDPIRRPEVTAANDSAKTDATVATVAVIGGALLVSTAVVLFFVARSRSTSGLSPTVPSIAGSF